jgi:hypothetical protein
MPIKIKSTSGSVTLDAQNVSGDQTLIVPSLAGGKTLLTIDGDGSSLTGVGVDGIVSTANATSITIDSNENVGIGITSPGIIAGGTRYLTTGTQSANAAGFFELVGNRTANASQDVAIIKFVNNTTQIAEIGAYDNGSTNGGDLKFFTSSGGTTTERLVINSDGNLGLGVTPANWTNNMKVFQLGSAAITNWNNDAELYHCANVYYDGSWKYIASDYATLYVQAGNGKHKFLTADSVPGSANTAATLVDVMVINATGNCAHTYTGGGGGMTINRTDSSGAATLMQFFTGGNLRGHIDYNGSAVVYYTSSDYRLKENVEPMSGSIDRLMQLKPSRFNFIENPTMDMDGFIAHEVQSIVPEAISGQKDDMMMEEYEVTPAVMDDDGVEIEPAVMGERTTDIINPQGIDQSKLVPLITAALQSALEKIENLTTRIEALENN